MKKYKKSKSFVEFAILAQEPYRSYLAGNQVKGQVRLCVVRPIRITHLVIYLHGYVDVRGGPGSSLPEIVPNTAIDLTSRVGKLQAKAGVLTLFETYAVLAREGPLGPAKYSYGFDVGFPTKRSHRLPSSLTFERGSISYLLTAVLTQPPDSSNSSSPVHMTTARLNFIERVDVGTRPVPLPITLYIEPRPKRRKQKGVASPSVAEMPTPEQLLEVSETQSCDASARHIQMSFDDASDVDDVARMSHSLPPRSPVQSDGRSQASFGAESSLSAGATSRSTRSLEPYTLGPSLDRRTITATFTLKHAGWLPGDVISIKCFIQHFKPIHSARGLVVTLYREARIDTSRSGDNADSSTVSEDSWTALSSLSLSSGGSVSRFRKELCQSYIPIYLDPTSMSAEVVPKVKVPTNSFPTLEKLPTNILSFIYYAEILLDLDGRMSSLLHNAARGSKYFGTASGDGSLSSDRCDERWSHNFWDTEYLRRVKGTIAIRLPIIVGSMDSSRHLGEKLVRRQYFEYCENRDAQSSSDFAPSSGSWEEVHGPYGEAVSTDLHEWPQSQSELSDRHPSSSTTRAVDQPYAAPADTLPEEQRLPPEPHRHITTEPSRPSFPNEKENLQAVEQSLILSCPPQDDYAITPSAPPLVDSVDDPPSSNTPSYPSAPALDNLYSNVSSNPSGLAYECGNTNENAVRGSTDDKQELERRRLMVEASSPGEVPLPPDQLGGESSSSWAASVFASAPFIESENPAGDEGQNAPPLHNALPPYES